jgi:high affinity Mn2+ porin
VLWLFLTHSLCQARADDPPFDQDGEATGDKAAPSVGKEASYRDLLAIPASDPASDWGAFSSGPSIGDAPEGPGDQKWALHTQATFLSQGYPRFPAKYTFPGTNSLPAGGEIRETLDLDLFAGARLWQGAAVYADVEYYQGFGVNQTLGIASFPSGEAYKVGSSPGYIWFPNVFFQQVIPLEDPMVSLSPDLLQLAAYVPQDRLTVTIGRFWAGYFFDRNRYANDPRTQFMNWGLVNTLSFDYAADSIGSTYGVAVEVRKGDWAVRTADLMVPLVPNGLGFDWSLLRAWQIPLEFEWDWRLGPGQRAGSLRILGWVERSHAGKFAEAVVQALATGLPPDITLTRAYRYEYGVALSLDQECTDWMGVFLRMGWRSGDTEVVQFTDADRSIAAGASLAGNLWGRKEDALGIGGVVADISSIHAEYLALGGLTFMIGDGALSRGVEGIGEIYYRAQVAGPLQATLDYQYVADPGYNQARGPVHLIALRLHFQY